MTTITIECKDEDLQMFYMPLTIESQNKITLLAPENITITPGEKVTVDLKLILASEEPILIYPVNALNTGPIITPNFSNIYTPDNVLTLFYNPGINTYKDLVTSGIAAFKTDLLKQFTKGRSNEELMDKIIGGVPAHTIAKGDPLFDIYNFNLKPFMVTLV
tara:strand:- start:1172 stop:1654 length:483 start_codon:yes stop_codon:yes gene_type:complete